MSQTEIEPFGGLGSLCFGMTREAVRSTLGCDYITFYKSVDDPNKADSYDGLGLHLYYDEQDLLEFIEAFPPCRPIFEGIDLLANPRTVATILAEKGHRAVMVDASSMNFEDLGFVLYVPLKETEAVSVYRRGYYDENVREN